MIMIHQLLIDELLDQVHILTKSKCHFSIDH